MFRLIIRSTVKLNGFCGRYGSCWCPEEPCDPCTCVSTIDNGVRVAIEQNLSPLTCVSLFVAVGARYEPSHLNGITHFIEHLAYKGFAGMNRSQVEKTVHDVGVRMTVKTKRDMQVFSVFTPVEEAHTSIRLLSDIIFKLDINQYEIINSKCNMASEKSDFEINPRAVLFDYLHSAAFQGTPLARPIIAPLKCKDNLTRANAACYVCENYTSNRLIVAISGNVNPREMLGQVASTFGHLPVDECIPDPGPQRYTGSQIEYRDDSMPHAHVAIALEAPGYNSSDYLKMLVMSCIIGSWHKSQGRPMLQPFYTAQACASMGSCESYESFYIAYEDVGLWGMYFVSDQWRLDEIIMSVQEAWLNMATVCHKSDVEKGKNLAKLKIARRYDGSKNSAFDIGTQMMYTNTRWSYESYVNQLNRISVNSIIEAGSRYIYDRIPVVAGIGRTESLPVYARIQSGMYWLRF